MVDHGVAASPVEVGDEGDAAGVVLEFGVVEVPPASAGTGDVLGRHRAPWSSARRARTGEPLGTTLAQLQLLKDTARTMADVHPGSAPGAPTGGADVPARADVVVVGAGVIGLSVAWRTAAAGMQVVMVDPEPGRGASWAAAGMLAPVTELHYGEETLLALTLAAARHWERFASDLAAAAGQFGYLQSGTLLVAADEDDRAQIHALYEFQRELGLEVEWCTARRARDLEPALSPGVRSGLWVPGDHQVHNRQLLAALRRAVEARGVQVVVDAVDAVDVAAGAAQGVRLASGAAVRASSVVLAAGCRSPLVGGLPARTVPAVRPVKGQIVRLRRRDGSGAVGPARTVRAVVEGASVYVVPRQDGTVVVGATVEEQGFDTTVTAGAVYELLRDARRAVPAVAEMVLEETVAGLRPGSPDNGPIVGPSGVVDGLVLATGHYRNGILLAPLTAEGVVAVLAGQALPDELAPFGPERFTALTG
jgi:glycine oxidase